MRIDSWNGEIGEPRWWARAMSFAAVLGALLGVLGPYGSYFNGGIEARVLYWIGMTASGTVIAGVLVPLLFRLGTLVALPKLFSFAVAIVVAAVPISAVSAMAGHLAWGVSVTHLTVADWYGQALLTSVVVIGLWTLFELATDVRREPAMAAPLQPAFRGAEPAGPVLCLQMEDHYVRVHRPGGSTLVLLPLQEAIGRFGRAGGLQVHRSWWVATAAVAGAERDARNWRLRLTNGLTVPVARNRVNEARTRGWIAADPS